MPFVATPRGAAVPERGRECGAVACHSPLPQRNMGYKRRWKQSSWSERHYTGRFYTPINRGGAVFNEMIGRIRVRVFPTGAGPLYRFRAEFIFCYPDGPMIDYFPDDSLRELERAVRKARKVVRYWERFQMRPTLVKIVMYKIGWFG